MLKDDGTEQYLISGKLTGVIRRIPMVRHGQKGSREWSLGQVVLEAVDEETGLSERVHLITFEEEMIETLMRIGEGKRVRIAYHYNMREDYDFYRDSLVLDSIEGMTEAETYIYNQKEVKK